MKKQEVKPERILGGVVVGGVLLAFLFSTRPWAVNKVPWRPTFESAMAEAKKTGKPVFIDFYADWCGPCKMMEQNTFTDEAVGRLVSQSIPVRVNIDKRPDIVKQYPSPGIPYVCLIRPNGQIIKAHMGYLGPNEFTQFWKSQSSPGPSHGSVFL